MTTLRSHAVDILAPVPAGRDVLVATLRPSADSSQRASLVLDLGARTLYCGESLRGPLHGDVRSTTDPLGVLGRFSWVVESCVTGRVVGAICTSQDDAQRDVARTVLFLES